jgi:hypothetical protein
MIKVFYLDNRVDTPTGERLGSTKAGGANGSWPPGAVWVDFQLPGENGARLKVVVDADDFDKLANAMIKANECAAIQAFGWALQNHDDPTLEACGQILIDQRQKSCAAAPPPITV